MDPVLRITFPNSEIHGSVSMFRGRFKNISYMSFIKIPTHILDCGIISPVDNFRGFVSFPT